MFCKCGERVSPKRYALGYRTCLVCGEKEARQVKHTVVPIAKSNYTVVTDYSLLSGLNKHAQTEPPSHAAIAARQNRKR